MFRVARPGRDHLRVEELRANRGHRESLLPPSVSVRQAKASLCGLSCQEIKEGVGSKSPAGSQSSA